MQEQDELFVIEAARNGSQAAFTVLHAKYKNLVKNHGRKYIRDYPSLDVDDLAQEVFMRAFTKLHTYRSEAKFSTWLLTICSNQARMMIRDHNAPRFGEGNTVSMNLPQHYGDTETENDYETCRISDDNATADMVEASITVNQVWPRLIFKYRRILDLRVNEELNDEEISNLLGMTEGGAKNLLHRARKQFAKKYLARR